ncbi:DUF1360 domain-containing protein [Stenotrophomonas sp. NPDC087984]
MHEEATSEDDKETIGELLTCPICMNVWVAATLPADPSVVAPLPRLDTAVPAQLPDGLFLDGLGHPFSVQARRVGNGARQTPAAQRAPPAGCWRCWPVADRVPRHEGPIGPIHRTPWLVWSGETCASARSAGTRGG